MTASDPISLFEPAFAQRALLAVVLIAVAAAALGGTIVLRDLPFFTHAVGTGAYPVLVIGVISGAAVAPVALLGTAAFALAVGLLSGLRRGNRAADEPGRRDALIGLAVAGALAIGAVLAATAGASDSRLSVSPEALLFGSILTVSDSALVITAGAVLAVALVAQLLRERWLAAGFDPTTARQLGAVRTDVALLACVALAVGAALPVTGSLLAGALLIAPAATARIVVGRAWALTPVTLAVALFDGVFGLYLALALDLPPGAAIAAVAGGLFLLTAGAAAVRTKLLANKSQLAGAAMLLLALTAAGCGAKSDGPTGEGKLKVVATTPQVADIVKNVGGDAVEVEEILPPGADPHEYEPKPSAVSAIAEADVVFRSGGDIDAWLQRAISASGGDVTQVDLSRSAVLLPAGEADHEEDHAAGDHEGEAAFNAHWYLAPENVVRASARVRDELVKAEPAARETFRANASAYDSKASRLQSALMRCSKEVPSDDRRLLAGHNDFNYLADAMNYKVVAQLAENGESEPSASALQDAVDTARASRAKALVMSRGEVTQLGKQTAAKLDIPLLELWADSLGKSGASSTLLGAITYDANSILSATGGTSNCIR